jgi:hypothetical protein
MACRAYWPQTFRDYGPADVEVMTRLWERKFAPYGDGELATAIERLSAKSRFMPSVSEVLAEVLALRHPGLNGLAAEEWDVAVSVASGLLPKESASDRTLRALEAIGRHRVRTRTADGEWRVRNDFMALYEALRDEERELLAMGDNLLTGQERERLAGMRATTRPALAEGGRP